MAGLAWFKENISWDLFDALSPGLVRKTSLMPTKTAAEAAESHGKVYNFFFPVYNFLFPIKDHNHGEFLEARYGWKDIPIRWFLGENKAELLDLMTESYAIRTSTAASDEYMAYRKEIKSFDYALRENFFIGHDGENKGKLNLLALLNPFNYFRALDNFLINSGLRLIAYSKDPQHIDFKKTNFKPFFATCGGVLLCGLGAILRLPRVITQYVVGASVKPLWQCYKFNKTYEFANLESMKEDEIKTPLWLWCVALLLTCINVTLIGLTLGGAAPALNFASDALGKALTKVATPTLEIALLNDKITNPITEAINSNITLPAELGTYASVFPNTHDCVVAGLAQAPLYSANTLHTYLAGDTVAHNKENEYREYPVYYPRINK